MLREPLKSALRLVQVVAPSPCAFGPGARFLAREFPSDVVTPGSEGPAAAHGRGRRTWAEV